MLKVTVMGGSLGGLTAALLLRDLEMDVEIFERAERPLEGRGAGIVLHPVTIRYLTVRGLHDAREIGAPARWLRYLDRRGAIASEQPCSYRFISFAWLYQELLHQLNPARYHLGCPVVAFEQDHDGVTLSVAGETDRRCGLLVCADGIHSTARRLLLPDVESRYAGYVGWRGTVEEKSLSSATFKLLDGAITYYLTDAGHILVYPIPNLDGSLRPGDRLMNWVWYRNVKEGSDLEELLTDRRGLRRSLSMTSDGLRPSHIQELNATGERDLPSPLAEIVSLTDEPFVQAVFDIEVPKMAFGRICLIGDAAFALRPHAAAGTAKAAEDAWRLAASLVDDPGDPVRALQKWEPGQLRLGRDVLARTREAGERFQFQGTWPVGDPLSFGLYRAGDSALPVDRT